MTIWQKIKSLWRFVSTEKLIFVIDYGDGHWDYYVSTRAEVEEYVDSLKNIFGYSQCTFHLMSR